MNKRKVLAVCAAILAALVLIAAVVLLSTTRRISVVSGERYVDKCPRRARPGQEVTVTTAVVSDAELYVNGVDGRFVRPGVFVFTMPDEDVQIKVTVIAYPDGA